MTKTSLVIGTFDTKNDELTYLSARIEAQGGRVLSMDVKVLGDPATLADISKHAVIGAVGETIDALIALGEEGAAFEKMSARAALTTRRLSDDGRLDGMIALGGTMGTDLALDCAQALPIGLPKYIVSTVAGSPLVAAERMAADVQYPRLGRTLRLSVGPASARENRVMLLPSGK